MWAHLYPQACPGVEGCSREFRLYRRFNSLKCPDTSTLPWASLPGPQPRRLMWSWFPSGMGAALPQLYGQQLSSDTADPSGPRMELAAVSPPACLRWRAGCSGKTHGLCVYCLSPLGEQGPCAVLFVTIPQFLESTRNIRGSHNYW